MLTLQIGNLGNMGLMNCLVQGGLYSLSALVYLEMKKKQKNWHLQVFQSVMLQTAAKLSVKMIK